MKRKPLTVVLPTYDEAGHIASLISEIDAIVHPEEIIVVDDCSPDGTAAVVRRLSRRHPHIRCITNTPVLGLTGSIQAGINAASQPYICWMDADGSHPPETLNRLFAAQKTCDVAIASVFVSGGGVRRDDTQAIFFSVLINRLCQLLFGTIVTYYTSGCIMTRADLLCRFPLRGDYGEYCIDFLVRAVRGGLRISEVGYISLPRHSGRSKTANTLWGFLIRGRKYIWTIVRLYARMQ